MRYASIGGLALLLLLLVIGYDHPPEGLTVRGDEARAEGFVVHVEGVEGSGRFRRIRSRAVPEPLPPEEELWLREHGFAYSRFEPDKSETGRILRGSYEPVGGGTPVYGLLVYER